MSALNPYEQYLDGRPLETALGSTAAQLGLLIEAIGEEKACVPPAPGKWSAAEILCHLADCELVFAFRLRQTLAEDAPVIQPLEQEKWPIRIKALPRARRWRFSRRCGNGTWCSFAVRCRERRAGRLRIRNEAR